MCGATGGITWRTLRRGCSDNLLRGGDDLRLDGCFGIFVNVNRLAQRLVWFQDIRVDDVLTIRDAGTEGELPHSGMVKQLVGELIRSLSPLEANLKVRRDAGDWNEIVAGIPGFELEGSEYRRPHWINVWHWTRESAAQAARAARAPRFRR